MNAIEVVCAVISDDQGRMLIGKRRSKVADGIWEFPGGKVENHETKEAACIREIKEELSLDIVTDGLLLMFTDTAFEPHVHVNAYKAHIIGGTLSLHAHSEYAWVSVEQLDQYRFQAADCVLLELLRTSAVSH